MLRLLYYILLSSVLATTLSSASLLPKLANSLPTIQLDNGSFIGTSDGTVNKFSGIPFAKPPTGDLRFRLPVPNDPYEGTYDATNFGPVCSQQNATSLPNMSVLPPETLQFLANNWSLAVTGPDSEDCLTVNVIAPVDTKPDAKLPVAAWIYGYGFLSGGSSAIRYNGSVVVQRSIELGEPIIYVSMNYRLNGFGFLASKEVKEAGVGNLGLQDQREALRWIQKYIAAFGGDPQKVTIWGESAGAWSVALQMVTNGGNPEGLFRAAFMQSGSPMPFGGITEQGTYDFLVSETGCDGAADTLQCLREVPYAILKAAIDKREVGHFRGLKPAWGPHTDGKFLVDDAQKLVVEGSIARVPFVTGASATCLKTLDCDDEGTLFSLAGLNITTDDEFSAYMKQTYFPKISDSDLAALLEYYPANVTQGSPFDTGSANTVTPEFKRLSAISGDLGHQAPRRFFLKHTATEQNAWVFLFKRFKYLPVLGSLHASDLIDIFGGKELTDYLIHFVNHLDPNGHGVPAWPRFSLESRKLLTLLDGDTPVRIGEDDYRVEGMELLTKVLLETPL